MTETIETAVITPEEASAPQEAPQTAAQAEAPESTPKAELVEIPTFVEAHSGKPERRAKWHRDRRLAQQTKRRKCNQRVAREARRAELNDTRKRLGHVPAARLESKPRASRLWMFRQNEEPVTA